MTRDRPLRLLYVSARYPPYVGGTEIHTAEVATRLAAHGHHVSVLTTDPTHTVPFEDVRDGVRVLSVPAWPKERDWYVAPAISRLLRDEPRDLLHVQGFHTAVAPLAMATAVRHRQPFVLTFHSGGHSSWIRRTLRPVQRAAMQPLLRRADCLIGVSDFETELFARGSALRSSRFETIPNGTSFEPVRPSAVSADHPGRIPARVSSTPSDVCHDEVERCHIVSVGRLERYKGYDRVIAALPTVRERAGDVRYTIVGSGPDRDRLLDRAARLGVRDLVEIRSVPADRRDELAEVVASASMFVLMSDYESHGMAVLEARSLGVPILVAATSALAALADQPGVWVVPVRSRPDELGEAIVEVLREPRHVGDVELPRWDDIAERLLDVYRRVLDRRETSR